MRNTLLFFGLLVIKLTTAHSASAPEPETPILTINGVKEFIRAKKIQTLEQFLSCLPGDYLSHYTLLFTSRSLQDASFTYPRALIFGSNAKFILTFNGSPEQRGFDALELLEYNELSKSFQLEEIEFTAAGSNTGKVSFSGRNPDKCLRCHGQTPRPLWDAAPLWPGSYGQLYRQKLSTPEADGLSSYLRQQATHPRYQYLSNTQPYRDPSTFYPSRHQVYDGVEVEAPNARLTQLLTLLNNQKIIQQVVSSPQFERFQYALLASVGPACNTIQDNLPLSWREQVAPDYAQFISQDELSLQRQKQKKQQRSAMDHAMPDTVGKDNSLRDFRYLAQRGLGIDTSQWSMALETNTPDFTALEPVTLMIENKLIGHISARDSKLMHEYYFRNYPGHNRYCVYLEKQSQTVLNALPIAEAFTFASSQKSAAQTGNARQILDLCASCHTSGAAPLLEFNQPAALALRLNLPYSTSGTLLDEILYRISTQAGARRMPPTVNFSERELLELRQYFEQLAEN